MTRFVVCGEALIDLVKYAAVAGRRSASGACIHGEDDSFSSAWQAQSAGGPLNTAVALGRLGADSHFLGRLSTDDFGSQLRQHLELSAVSLDLAVTTPEFTSLAVVSLDDHGKASYAFHFDGTANFGWHPDELPELSRADWLHVASLATVVAPGAQVLLDWIKTTPARLSYDINVRPSVVPDPAEYWNRVEPWLVAVGGRNGIVKASDDDINFLARGQGEHRVATQMAADWVDRYGLAAAVVTLGSDGAVAVLPGGTVSAPGIAVDLVDTVGAGDTFMAGFLDALLDDHTDVGRALRRGIAASAIVCSRRGAQPPTADEVDALLDSEQLPQVGRKS